MFYLILSLIILGLAAAALSFRKKNEPVRDVRPEGCCGCHAVCEHASELKANAPCPADYYDDEELDRFRLRNGDDYSEAETQEFREVLYSLAQGEAEGWLRSLDRRGVLLPAALQNDAAIILAEAKGGDRS